MKNKSYKKYGSAIRTDIYIFFNIVITKYTH